MTGAVRRTADVLITRILPRQMTWMELETSMGAQTHRMTRGRRTDMIPMNTIQTQMKQSNLCTKQDLVKCQYHHTWASLCQSSLIKPCSSNNSNKVPLSLINTKTTKRWVKLSQSRFNLFLSRFSQWQALACQSRATRSTLINPLQWGCTPRQALQQVCSTTEIDSEEV